MDTHKIPPRQNKCALHGYKTLHINSNLYDNKTTPPIKQHNKRITLPRLWITPFFHHTYPPAFIMFQTQKPNYTFPLWKTFLVFHAIHFSVMCFRLPKRYFYHFLGDFKVFLSVFLQNNGIV